MNREAGFSLTEMMVALFVLSLASIPLAEITGTMIADWDRSERRNVELSDLVQIAERIPDLERQLIQPVGENPSDLGETFDNPPEVFARAKITLHADCEFDLVGRRCR